LEPLGRNEGMNSFQNLLGLIALAIGMLFHMKETAAKIRGLELEIAKLKGRLGLE
jgi:hypothetical protein